jgi:hypothetical protein
MTGIFVRVQRAGRWANAEFDQLTDDEMEAFVARHRERRTPEEAAPDGWGWAMALAQWIRDHVQQEAPQGGRCAGCACPEHTGECRVCGLCHAGAAVRP